MEIYSDIAAPEAQKAGESAEDVRYHWRPQRFAPRVGGRYDKVITLLRGLLPASAIALAVVTAAYPFFNERETSFVLARDSVEASEDRLRMVNPRYSGVDASDRPFKVQAASAVQPRGVADEVTLTAIAASMELAGDIDVSINAGTGTYRPSQEILTLSGPVEVVTSNGYRIDASDSVVDLDDHLVTSDQKVDAAGPLGRFKAKGFQARIDEDKLIFTGGVVALITPQKAALPMVELGDDSPQVEQ